MNERIRELAEQAFGSTIDTDPILVYEAEKFAELIVRECMFVLGLGDSPTGCEDWNREMDDVAKLMKHFKAE